jgi:hypothetical protein
VSIPKEWLPHHAFKASVQAAEHHPPLTVEVPNGIEPLHPGFVGLVPIDHRRNHYNTALLSCLRASVFEIQIIWISGLVNAICTLSPKHLMMPLPSNLPCPATRLFQRVRYQCGKG